MAPLAKKAKLEIKMDSGDSAMGEPDSDEGNCDYSDDAMDEAGSGNDTAQEGDGNDSELEIIDRAAEPAEELPVEPTPFKLSARKQFAYDIAQLVEKYGSPTGESVRDFKREDEETIHFTLVHSGFPKRGLRLVLMLPEVAGYPLKHQVVCYTQSEIGPEIEAVMAEVAALPQHADRSIAGIVDFLVARLVRNEPSDYLDFAPPQSSQNNGEEEYDDPGYDDDEDAFGIPRDGIAARTALRNDFKLMTAAGYQPGYTQVSQLDTIISVAVKVNSLGVPLRALQAWDSDLITGEVRYLVLLLFCGYRYPPDPDNGARGEVRFKVGISPKYKPSRAALIAASRSHNDQTSDGWTKGEFESISLSAPLESLMNEKFPELLLIRRSNANVSWAAAEAHCFEHTHKRAVDRKASKAADKEEKDIASSHQIPEDPVSKTETSNCYPLIAFSYLIRRFVMCTTFCLVCYKRVQSDVVALKPYVCENSLCLYQYEKLHLGPSLEHEIKTNAPAVDLLIQLAYASAVGQKLTNFPDGLELQVPVAVHLGYKKGDPTVDFDTLTPDKKNSAIEHLIMELPPVSTMRDWLLGINISEEEIMSSKARTLKEMKGASIPHAAWKLVRWIVASNTAYLKLIEEEDELVQGVPSSYRQFRLVVGSPAKEHLLKKAIEAASVDNNAQKYPTLFAFHGSAVANWHSILREGLHFKQTVNGRAYGHGVYFAKEGSVSLGTYATLTSSQWKNADWGIGRLAAICEINNQPSQFVSTNPYFVVNQLDWIQCRYLLVQRGVSYNYDGVPAVVPAGGVAYTTGGLAMKQHPLDPKHPILLENRAISIPDILPKLEAMNRRLDNVEEERNASDTELINEPEPKVARIKKKTAPRTGSKVDIDLTSDEPTTGRSTRSSNSKSLIASSSSQDVKPSTSSQKVKVEEVVDDFVPMGQEFLDLIRLLPPPTSANTGASLNIRREMKAMIKQQKEEGPTKCGFYFDPERSGDNIFTWVVELLGFDPDLPLSKDMKKNGVSSLLMEIRFPESYPLGPPFFRIVYPRFLPFAQGGGGHITGGGSMCMDMLNSDAWSPAYAIPAVLLQIRMAISNLEPRPARLDPTHWKTPYSMGEAIDGFTRVAAQHGWTVDDSFKKLQATGGL